MLFDKPLAEILRPKSLDEFTGQDHLMGADGILRKSIEAGNIPSLIFWGPPGVGKTTLANLIAINLGRPFFTLSAVSSGVKDVRAVIEKSKEIISSKPILFIDEIHRFSKSQQDSLLGAVEQGIVTLIGATTENPSFEVISPLLSRCQVYILHSLDKQELIMIQEKATNYVSSQSGVKIVIRENEALLRISGGDARKLINAIELLCLSLLNGNSGDDIVVSNNNVTEILQKNLAIYDKSGEMHYDIISAFIKSMRGSDPNASVYWLARMIEGGEDPKFIARRMLILASEDIGNANPNALLLAQSCFDAVNVIGLPECRIILSQTAIYLASSPKSNASYLAINKAQDLVRSSGDLPVPLPIRNAPTRLMKELGYGSDYKYAHDFAGNIVDMEFMPDRLKNTILYEPQDNPRENDIRNRLRNIWKKKYRY